MAQRSGGGQRDDLTGGRPLTPCSSTIGATAATVAPPRARLTPRGDAPMPRNQVA